MNHAQLAPATAGNAGTQFQSAGATARHARAAPAPRLPPNDLRKLRGTLMRVGSNVLVRKGLVGLMCELGASHAEDFPVQPLTDALYDLGTVARCVAMAAHSAAAGVEELCGSANTPSEIRELAVSVNTIVQLIFRIRDETLPPEAFFDIRECANIADAVETLESLQRTVQGADQLYQCAFELLGHVTAIEQVTPPHDTLDLASRLLRKDVPISAFHALRQAVLDFRSRCSMELTPDLLHAAADDAVPPSFYSGDEPIFEAVARSFDEEGLDVGAVLRALPGREDDVWAFLQRPDVWIQLMDDFNEDDPATLPLVKMPEGAAAERLEPVLRAISGLVGRKPHVVVHLAPGQTCNLNLDFPNKKAAAKVLEIDIACDSMAEGEIIVGPAVQVASESREPCPWIGLRTADGRNWGYLGERGSLWI